ncbi:Cytochrome P450 83B1 [Vitis vinifera]|uniref:Cytochrome P450 83B1 n=1 Tax=Vitis vinifera TaxID=29760 RepID=A0A438G763_VITVI|nr:Cytochrome P450 83B1 [Vitis vinifera]
MKKAQEEVRNTFGKKGFIGEDDVEKLPYLKAVVKETMRLLPAAPLLVQEKHSEVQYRMEEFIPERFLGSSVDFRGQNYKLIPFGAGRRVCPAIHIGAVTVELTLANLLYSFDWEMPAGMNKEDIDFDVHTWSYNAQEECSLPYG